MENRVKTLEEIKDPTKRAILSYLLENGVSYLGEILKHLAISYSRGYKYLEEMEREGLVETMTEPPKFKAAI